MCNDKNNPIRKGAINKDLKGIHFISALWRKGMAAPSGEKILKQIQNGTLNPDVIKQNVFLYASLINTAIEITKNPEKYQNQLNDFLNINVDEQEKAESFLKLIMQNPDDRKIYMERWESVKDAEVFQKNSSKGFAKNRFKKEQFKEIATRTPYQMVRSAHNYIKEILSNTREKGVISDGR